MKESMIVLAMMFMKYKVESVDGKTNFEIGIKLDESVVVPKVDKVVLKPRL